MKPDQGRIKVCVHTSPRQRCARRLRSEAPPPLTALPTVPPELEVSATRFQSLHLFLCVMSKFFFFKDTYLSLHVHSHYVSEL